MKELELLGQKVKDSVTGYTGIVTSISHDLYGCIQACVASPCKDISKQLTYSFWLDTNRLIVLTKKPVMKSPHLSKTPVAKGNENLPRKA